MKVFVYFNLHKKLWSIKSLKTGRVIAHANTVQLKDVKFKVSEAGRQRVLKEKRKNVHAGVVGTLIAKDFFFHPTLLNDVISYNPYKGKYFYNVKNDKYIHNADGVILAQKKVYI